jgi:hypothetical protein
MKIKLTNRKELMVDIYDHNGIHPEITVYIAEDGIPVQDICVVRPHKDNKVNDTVDCIVWSDECDEDYTHKFVIKQYKEND